MTGRVVQVLNKFVKYPGSWESRAYLVKLDNRVDILGTWENHFPIPEIYLNKISKKDLTPKTR
jgi:hypothetical protein